MNKFLGFGLALSLLVVFGSCKPKQSAYKSVYQAAKERELEDNKTTPSTPTYPAYTSNVENEPVRSEQITAVYDEDAEGLRAYSVVIASLSVKPNAEVLKKRMEQEGYRVILAQNTQGMYRVIIASHDDKAAAVNVKNDIRNKYQAKGTNDVLRKTYGIPFDDLWILQRKY
ncbi:MAG: hypothetical protein RL662_1711 [Bacteroidota bacterium]|jgi:cell division septation protein DedD